MQEIATKFLNACFGAWSIIPKIEVMIGRERTNGMGFSTFSRDFLLAKWILWIFAQFSSMSRIALQFLPARDIPGKKGAGKKREMTGGVSHSSIQKSIVNALRAPPIPVFGERRRRKYSEK